MSAVTTAGDLAPWRWRDGAMGLLLAAAQTLALWQAQPAMLQGWRAVLAFWNTRLGGAWLRPEASSAALPSATLVLVTALLVAIAYGWTARWPERFWPARMLLRGLCLVQASACLFWLWAPARFPYGLNQHLHALLQLGADMMLTMPLLLCLGWGLLRLPWHLKLLGPVGVLAYFALWLPHQVALHAWLLSQASVLFMPVLFLGFGILLDGWIFIALYAWLASLTPRVPQRQPTPGARA